MQGSDADQLVNKLARVTSEWEGLAGELEGARAMLVNFERAQDGLVAEGLPLRNNITKMAKKLTSVGAKRKEVIRELSSEQDRLINKVLLCETMPRSW